MKRKLFWHVFAGAMAVFAACFSVTIWAVYGYFTQHNRQQLEAEAAYLGAAVENIGIDFLRETDRYTHQRITWIDADGSVLYDS